MKKEAAVNLNRIEREDMTLLRDPGYIYDLIFVFVTNVDLDVLSSASGRDNNLEKDSFLRFVKNEIRPYFGEISDDLYIFFHLIEHGRCFVSLKYFKAASLKDINFEKFCASLSDKERLIRNLIKFYFYDLDKATVDACVASIEKIFPIIKKSSYSAEEKTRLYEFFHDPDHYIDLLIKELREKEKLLAQYYEDNYGIAIDMFNGLTYDALAEQMLEIQLQDYYQIEGARLYLSFCILNKNLIFHIGNEDSVFAVLGCNYKEVVERGLAGKTPDLKGFGCVLAEESRVKILAYMLKNGEATCKDLEKNFSFSGTTAYHHVTMMARVGIVKSHVVKKTVYYSINRKYVDKVIKVLLDYSNYNDINEVK